MNQVQILSSCTKRQPVLVNMVIRIINNIIRVQFIVSKGQFLVECCGVGRSLQSQVWEMVFYRIFKWAEA